MKHNTKIRTPTYPLNDIAYRFATRITKRMLDAVKFGQSGGALTIADEVYLLNDIENELSILLHNLDIARGLTDYKLQ